MICANIGAAAADTATLLTEQAFRRLRRDVRPTPSHFGIYVTDVERMVAFYTEVFDLTITDRGVGRTFTNSPRARIPMPLKTWPAVVPMPSWPTSPTCR